MEKQTRINKYKDLRDEMKEEVAIDRHVTMTPEDEDDDFLAFLPRDEKPSLDDTLMEPLSYETLNKDNEEVKMALNEAKVNVGKEQYNTRLDILNKIKQDESSYIPSKEDDEDDNVSKKPQKKMSLLEKLAAMSPEEDAEELKKYEEDLTVADFVKEHKKHKKQSRIPVEEETVQVERPQLDGDDEEEEDESKVVTILNYVIIAFIIVFIVLAFFIVKQLLF